MRVWPCRVLVLDDHVDGADALGVVLSLEGYEARVCYDVPSALAALEAFAPDICLFDIGLPGLDGYKLASLVRARYGDRHWLVALSGYAGAHSASEAFEAGYDLHFAKPIDIADLMEWLKGLRAPSLLREVAAQPSA